jgi:hypothetical protein
MKLVKHIDPRLVTMDDTWNITASYDGQNTITVSVVTSFTVGDQVIESVNTTNTFDLTQLNLTDFSIFALMANVNQTSMHEYHEQPTNYLPAVTSSTILDVFAYTKDSKMTFDQTCSSLGMLPYAALIVPYANCTTDEMIFLVRSPINITSVVTCTGFQTEITPTDSNRMFGLLPTLTTPSQQLVAPVGEDVPFVIQLTGAFDIPVNRAGVTIYLEATGGVLTSQRLVTDANGTVTGYIQANDTTPFEITAGFKNFSGILDIYVN